ncbi:uncharacterized protein LOC115531973 isoform X2 [Gadus morhua]|uniref:uncharacterized protein LOC115531973 isoform X2 n=1 Tax=Gadus morhua TaxID=8049 RepID=UPI0011B84ED6|nr:uncharacterized protein LOC115531973 isoform X2 [Gadus morhua]
MNTFTRIIRAFNSTTRKPEKPSCCLWNFHWNFPSVSSPLKVVLLSGGRAQVVTSPTLRGQRSTLNVLPEINKEDAEAHDTFGHSRKERNSSGIYLKDRRHPYRWCGFESTAWLEVMEWSFVKLYLIGSALSAFTVFFSLMDSFGGLMYGQDDLRVWAQDHQRPLTAPSSRTGPTGAKDEDSS